MATIGSFKKVNAEFQGEIVTLTVRKPGASVSFPRPTAVATLRPPTGSSLAAPKLAPPDRSALPKAATISRSSSTTRASTHRPSPTSSTARTTPTT
jgi:hypothetical protein